MKQKIWITVAAFVFGASTLTIGYAASKSGEEGMSCEKMMSEHMGKAEMNRHQGMMGKDHMGMMGSEIPKECEEMMRKHGMPATESPSAKPPAPAS